MRIPRYNIYYNEKERYHICRSPLRLAFGNGEFGKWIIIPQRLISNEWKDVTTNVANLRCHYLRANQARSWAKSLMYASEDAKQFITNEEDL